MPDFYGDAAGFQAYWAARGGSTAAGLENEDIETALLIASEWIDRSFRAQFDGTKVGQRPQLREWPRNGAIDIDNHYIASDAIPREIISATYEAAMRHATTPGIFFKDYSPSKYKSVSISGALSVDYAIGSAYDFQTQFPAIAAILAPVLTGEGTGGYSGLAGSVAR